MSKEDGELAARWQVVTLAEICEVIQGQSPPGETYNDRGEGLPFFQGKAEFGPIYPTVVKWCSVPTKIAEPNDVLISIRAPVGPTNLCPVRACIGRGLAAIRPFGEIPSRYVLYALRNSEPDLASKGTGSTFAAISGTDLRLHPLPVAPLPEQHRIIGEIEKQFTRLDAAVAALKRIQANLRRYRASVLKAACEGRLVPTEAELARREGRSYETGAQLLARILKERRAKWEADQLAKMQAAGKPPKDGQWKAKYQEPAAPEIAELPKLPEGWAWATWNQIGFAQNGRSFPSAQYSPDGAKLLRPGNLSANGRIVWTRDNTRYLPKKWAQEFPHFIVGPHELVMNLTAQSLKDEFLGRVCLTGPGEECLLNQRLARLTPLGGLHEYFLWMFKSQDFRRFVDNLNKGSLIQHMFTSQLTHFILPLPPIAEQRRIVAEVERRLSVIDELERSVEAKSRYVDRLRQAILKRAFEGKLLPQDPNDEPASALLERVRAARGEQATGLESGSRKRPGKSR